jgi:hypothetical protein
MKPAAKPFLHSPLDFVYISFLDDIAVKYVRPIPSIQDGLHGFHRL